MMWFFHSADPDLPVMNGIFEISHGSEPPFLRILPAAFCFVFQVFVMFTVPFEQDPQSVPFSFLGKKIGEIFSELLYRVPLHPTKSFESGFLLEFYSPYLRLFSFCDYTIPELQKSVYSRNQQG